MPTTFITSYTNPDLDGVACSIAYSELLNKLGQNTQVVLTDSPHPEGLYLLNQYKIPLPPTPTNFEANFILVDTSLLHTIDQRINPNNVIEIIDHRLGSGEDKFPNANCQIELVGAAATLIAERFHQQQLRPTTNSAILLYGAIISNSLNFQAKVTTHRDHQMASWLNQELNFDQSFTKNLFAAKSDLTGSKLQETILSDLAHPQLQELQFLIGQLEIVNSQSLVADRFQEIITLLKKIHQDHSSKHTYLTILDLEHGFTYFISPFLATQQLLEKILPIKFQNSLAQHSELIMRKEIIPLIIDHLKP